MSIAKKVTSAIGARAYLPEGPYGSIGQFPFPSFAPGEVVCGELGAEFEFVLFPVKAAVTLNQGDAIVYDNSGYGVQSLTGSGAHPFGANVGFLFLGGRRADLSGLVAAGNIWSYTFAVGVYGIWVQRAGKTLINCATVNAQTKPLNTTAVAGQLNAPNAALAGSMAVANVFACPTSWTFTATTTSGQATLTGVTWTKTPGITIGQDISGTGITAGTVVTDFSGSTVTMSAIATANGSITVTVSNAQTYVTTTSGTPYLTNVTNIAGIYPNATLTGTGIGAAGSSTVVAITGNGAPYTIQMAANSSATANSISTVPSVYIEGFANWPTIGGQN